MGINYLQNIYFKNILYNIFKLIFFLLNIRFLLLFLFINKKMNISNIIYNLYKFKKSNK